MSSPRYSWVFQWISAPSLTPIPPPKAMKTPVRRGFTQLLAWMTLIASGVVGAPSFAGEHVTLPPQALAFEPNQGQAGGKHVEFLARGKGYLLYLRPTEAVLALKSPSPTTGKPKSLRMRLLGAAAHAKTMGQAPLPGRHNYYIGNDPARWHTNIPTYAKVAATGVYPGIDMVYYGKEGLLEYDFLVAAGADPRVIRLGFDGVDRLSVNPKGELLITTGKAQLVQHAPYAYQHIGDKQVPVTARYTLHNRSVSLVLGDYDHQRPLIIDPALSYSSYLGGSGDDKALAVAVDADGNIYVTGSTLSPDFPGAAATNTNLNSVENSDAFVTKISKSGSVIFSTYMGASGSIEPAGGEKGNGIDVAKINGQNEIYVTGGTAAGIVAFPSTPGAYHTCSLVAPDVFVSILNASDGQMNYSTCVGGGLFEEGLGIAVDSSGNAYVAGWTTSSNFPITPSNALQTTKTTPAGLRSSFFFKLDPTAGASGLLYSTYLGQGNNYCCDTYATAVAVDSNNNAYVAGWTGVTAPDLFPAGFLTTNSYQDNLKGAQDGFFYKINPAGNGISDLLYATYFGGSAVDKTNGIAVDTSGNIYISGQTTSSDFPTLNAIQATYGGGGTTLGDAFVAKFSPATQGGNDYGPSYSTYLGGSGEDGATGIAVDSSTGRAYVTGSTTSGNFPIQGILNPQTNLPYAFNNGLNTSAKDAFVTSIDASGSLYYSTYLGGELDDQGQGIAVAANDKAYVVGYTPSFTFRVTSDAAQPANQSNQQPGSLGFDAFVTRIAPVANLSVTIAAHPTNDLQSTTAPPLGDSLTYSIILVNLGPDPATGIALTVDLSVADALYLPTYDPNICQYDGHKLFTCSLPDLAAGDSQTLTIAGTLTTASQLVATATVNSNEIDAVATSYTLTASQTLPPPSTTVTGGTTPTSTPSTGGGGGALGPWALAVLLLAALARLPRGFRRIPV